MHGRQSQLPEHHPGCFSSPISHLSLFCNDLAPSGSLELEFIGTVPVLEGSNKKAPRNFLGLCC